MPISKLVERGSRALEDLLTHSLVKDSISIRKIKSSNGVRPVSNYSITRGQVTEMLSALSGPAREATDRFIPLVYDELRRQAHRYLRRERANHTLQTTGLVHEAYLRLTAQHNKWQNRAQFFAIAAQMMRWILVDYAARRNRVKRGGVQENLELGEALRVEAGNCEVDLLGLDEALSRLEELDEQQARIVELRYFSGLTVAETAEALDISPSTVKRDWNMASAWLRRELS